MIRTKFLFQVLLTTLLAIHITSCRPVIPKGEKVIMHENNLDKFWKQNLVKVNGDSVVLEEINASLISRFKVRDFTFSARIFTTGNAEGSLDFHAGAKGGILVKGYSIKINNSDYRRGSLEKTGSLSLIRNNFVRLADDGKWFILRAEVKGNTIKVAVNDKIIVEYIQQDKPSRIAGLEHRVLSDGYIVIRKASKTGTIAMSDMTIETYGRIPAVKTESMSASDSTTDMISVLNQKGFPVIDFHAHLKGSLTVDQLCEHGRINGYNYGIAPNCGLNFPVTNDSSLMAYYHEIASAPVFKAMQCEGREWVKLFSPDAIAHFDYIFTDAMTWTDHKGRRMRLWIPEETFVDDEQQFMDMLVEKIEAELSQEPVDIYVNPTYLPEVIASHYDRLWTPERMDRVIKVLVENDVALEINSRFRIPGIAFVKRAKAAGVKFTLGTNNAGNDDLGRLEYSLKIVKEAGLSTSDMFIPRPAGEKKVIKMGLPSAITG